MSNAKTTQPTIVREIISAKEAKFRIIRAGVSGDSAIKKQLEKLIDRKGESFSVVRTTKKIITAESAVEVQTSVSVRKAKDLPATSLADALSRKKSYKNNVADVNGKKQFVFLSWIRKDRETGDVLANPIPMINVNGTGRELFSSKHEVQFGLDS